MEFYLQQYIKGINETINPFNPSNPSNYIKKQTETRPIKKLDNTNNFDLLLNILYSAK